MRKRLTAIGNSFGVVIEKPILELLGMDRDAEFEMVTDGQRLLFSPVRSTEKRKRVDAAVDRVLARHEKTLRKLADK